MMSDETEKRQALVEAAKDLWEKARTNAFAHKSASNRNSFKSKALTMFSILFGFLSILAILFAYLVFQPEANVDALQGAKTVQSQDVILIFVKKHFVLDLPENTTTETTKSYIALNLTISSIIFSVVSLFLTIMSGIGAYASLSNEHEFLQSFCLDVSQKIRPLKHNRSTISIEDMIQTLSNLEEQFRLIKMRGSEPGNSDFDKAHKILRDRHLYRNHANRFSILIKYLFLTKLKDNKGGEDDKNY